MAADAVPEKPFPSPTYPIWDDALMHRYPPEEAGYAYFPPASSFTADIGTAALIEALSRRDDALPLAIDVNIPFCRSACLYCHCRPVILEEPRLAIPYLEHLDGEMGLFAGHLGTTRQIEQLYWHGGTPTFLSLDQMSRLVDQLDAHFGLSSATHRDYAIEIDPRAADVFTLRHLQALGFNRLSLGVQDLDRQVLRAVNRIQPRRLTEILIDEAMRLGFRSLNIDLIYGLPLQTRESFGATLEQIIDLAPARLTLHGYEHRPEHFGIQRQLNAAQLPDGEEKLAIRRLSHELLGAAGYCHIAMGLYARPDDDLVRAQREGRLYMGPRGFTSQPPGDLIGLGVSSISRIGNCHVQNALEIPRWEKRISNGQLASVRGLCLDQDERIRQYVIQRLTCDMALDAADIGARFDIDGLRYLERLQAHLTPTIPDDFFLFDGKNLKVTSPGRLAIAYLLAELEKFFPT
ncbi:oxygen-independent coproporphyrinogen III oxidase [Halomonas shantousis]